MIQQREVSALMRSMARVASNLIRSLDARLTARIDAVETLARSIPAGPEGPAGRDGKDGASGQDGRPGRDGVDGSKGLDGKDGIAGRDGKDGLDGRDGSDGKDGQRGIDGTNGRDGERGFDGKPGRDGIDGKDGQPGKDGIDGKHGERGLDGAPGRDGKDGKDGESIHPDSIRLMIVEEVAKVAANIRMPADGKAGTDGRDALQIEILPMIEQGKSYPRGTFAKHAGGVVRAVRNTDALNGDIAAAGWDVVMDGFQVFSFTRDETNPRHVTFSAKQTSGALMTYDAMFPVMIYQGVYKAHREYTHGDVVTFNNSAWHCNVEKTTANPGTATDWTLIVRKGQDGKPGTPGKDGEPGKEGPRGRDLTQMMPDGHKY